MKFQSTLWKILRKFKGITASGLLSVFERSIESCIIESVRNIILFVIAANWFSPIITSNGFAWHFWESKSKFCSLNLKVKVFSVFFINFLYMIDMTPVREIGGNSFEKMFIKF